MQEIKKSFYILTKNPFIILLFTLYLLAFTGTMKPIFAHMGDNLFIFSSLLLILFSVAFTAGWLGMIKAVVSYKETGNIEEDIQKQYVFFKKDFFESIPTYILPLAFLVILFGIYTWFLFDLADKLIGNTDEIAAQIGALADSSRQNLNNIMNSLPKETFYTILKRSFFIDFGYIIYFFLTFYSIPALYYNKSKNPLVALKDGVLSIIKKPLLSVGVLLFIILINIVLKLVLTLCQSIFSTSAPMIFLYIVASVYFTVFVVVLIFTVYEKHFTDNCNNGADSIGENEACN